jgi:hypothetical protein
MVGVKPPEMPVISSQCLWMICAPDMGQDWEHWLVIWESAKALQVIGLGQQQQHPWVSCSSLEELSESLLLKIRLYYKVSRSSSSRHGGSVGVVEFCWFAHFRHCFCASETSRSLLDKAIFISLA